MAKSNTHIVRALHGLVQQYQEDTPPENWPGAAVTELVVIGDCGHAIGLSDSEVRRVVGDPAFAVILDLLEERPVLIDSQDRQVDRS